MPFVVCELALYDKMKHFDEYLNQLNELKEGADVLQDGDVSLWFTSPIDSRLRVELTKEGIKIWMVH